ncbi:hypothetical protein DBR32_01910 [Taibaiella sp. KBW10]|uniref:Omp28-related outer membrane protein n=1 Tax=Taibaiella sp. KBW10 TaxID=2153357 RepID=UPI000F59AF0C|nr:Omp28-related outer membrane protein [Taibaiella sp. KBW10]RQO32383.1 hypothetical protein DBR32_01910 [Taibaiella sp. KBW10]
MSTKFLPAIAAFMSVTFLFSCKEQPVGIFTGENAKDSTYVGTVESPQTKNFYIEEFSGVRCVNCPAGATKLEEMMSQNPGRLKIVTIHAGGLTAPDYTKGSVQDLRTGVNGNGDGLKISNIIYGGDPSKPAASFDRMPVSPQTTTPLLGAKEDWDIMLSAIKTQNSTTPVNMYLSNSYNAAKDEYTIQVKLAYTQAVTEPQFLTIYLIEDKIVDQQVSPLIPNYEYNHVFRMSVTPFNGMAILDSIPNKESGRVFVTNYKLKIDRNDASDLKQKFWNLDNIHVVAFVHKGTSAADKRVLQAIDKTLK